MAFRSEEIFEAFAEATHYDAALDGLDFGAVSIRRHAAGVPRPVGPKVDPVTYARNYYRANKDVFRRRRVEWYARLREDPVRYAAFLERHREYERRKYAARPKAPKPPKPPPSPEVLEERKDRHRKHAREWYRRKIAADPTWHAEALKRKRRSRKK